MSAVTDWIANLKFATSMRAPIHPVVRRLLVPGIRPLHHEGLIRFQGVGPTYRPGLTPEAMSVMQLAVAGEAPDHMTDAELGAGIGAVLTLITDRRIEVLEEVPAKVEDSRPTTFIGYSNAFDRRLVSPFEAVDLDQRLRAALSSLASLPEEDQLAISAAIDLHYGSVLLFEKDLSAAYTLVVAGIEALSRRFGDPPKDWLSWEDAGSWDKFARSQQLADEQYEALKSKLMRNRQLRLKSTFVNYAASGLPESFWDQEWREWLYNVQVPEGTYSMEGSWVVQKHIRDYVTQDQEVLRRALRHSYDARSGFVHAGDRTINSMSEFYSQTHETSADRPLSYGTLRSILTTLVKVELDSRATEFVLPQLIIKHGERSAGT